MTVQRHFLISLAIAGAGCLPALAQSGGLTARQLYFKARPEAPAAKGAEKSGGEKAAPAKAAPKATGSSNAGSKAKAAADAGLGLRYAVVQAGGSGRMDNEVSAGKTFRSGEVFALKLEANESAYLYVFSVSNGELLYPGAAADAPQLTAMKPVTIPQACAAGKKDDCFEFDQNPGDEKLLVILSKTPDQALERMKAPSAAAQSKGTALASNKMSPAQLEQWRNQMQLEGRGIVRQTVTGPADGGEQGENAVYLVQTSDTSQRLITEISLRHQ